METHEVPEWALRELSQVLAPWERYRADQYLSPLDRREYLCAHALRRVLLSHCFHRPLRDWIFEADAFGKPAVLNRPPCGRFECNLSHTRGVVAAIAALDRAVGIDVERQDRSLEIDLAVLVCSPAEATVLHATHQSKKREKLLQLWVRKEALTKAIGRGLSMALPLMEVGDHGVTIFSKSVPDIDRPSDWQVYDLAAPRDAFFAAAAHSGGSSILTRHSRIAWTQLRHLVQLFG
nr:4'-phosphopantetheinyl transferase superfamily protein [Comamonas thiooxydans]